MRAAVILAAGLGKRMKSARPKVLHPLCGRPMLAWVVDQALALEPEEILVVAGHGADEVERTLDEIARRDGTQRVRIVRQEPQLGTGHALQCCAPILRDLAGLRERVGDRGSDDAHASADAGCVLVLYGDMPLLRAESLRDLLRLHAARAQGGAALLSARPRDPRGFGRVLRGHDGNVLAIVEERDATPEERSISEVNLGVYVFDARELLTALPLLSKANEQGEYYLTDVVGTLVESGKPVAALAIEEEAEAIGVNTLAHLAEARAALQARILEEHLENGVYLEDPATTTIDHGVRIGPGTKILPCTVIRSGVVIGTGCEVGPFTQLRAGTVLEDGAEIGNFTECKNARVGRHAKAKHLAYLGDATIGEETNIGAGTIFANYDGVAKHLSSVGKRAFIGSGTVIVAPNRIGDRATTGAGAVVKKNANIPAGEIWVGIPARKLERATSGARPPAVRAPVAPPASGPRSGAPPAGSRPLGPRHPKERPPALRSPGSAKAPPPKLPRVEKKKRKA